MHASRVSSILLVGVFCLIVAACGGSQSGGAQGNTEIVLGLPTTQTSFANSDVAVAEEQGYFEEQGISVTTRNFGSGVDVSQAVVSRDLQIGASSIEPVVQASTEGANFSIIGAYANRLSVSMVTPSSIGTASDLQGENLGIQDPGAFREIMTRMVLQTADLTPEDVTYRPVETTAYIGALLDGQISSAVLQTEQTVEVMNEDGDFHELVDLYDLEPDYFYGTYFVDKDWLAENEEAAVGFLTAITKAHRFMYENRDETVAIVAKTTGFDEKVIDKAYETLLVENRVFPVDDGLENDRLAYTLGKMEDLDLLTSGKPEISEVVDKGPATSAMKNLGPAKE